MKRILLVCPLILIPLLLANKVSSDTLHDCEHEIKELKDDAEDDIDTLTTMRSGESKARQELHSIKTTIIEVLHQKLFFKSPSLSTQAIYKIIGTIDLEEWNQCFEEAVDKYKVAEKYLDSRKSKIMRNGRRAHKMWQLKVMDIRWHPYRTIVHPNGRAEQLINLNDPLLMKCRKDLGDEVCSLVVKAVEEVEEYNPSRGNPRGIPWDYANGVPIEYAQVLLQLEAAMQRADDVLHQLKSGFNEFAQQLNEGMLRSVRQGRFGQPPPLAMLER